MVISKLLVSLLLNVSLDFLSIFTPDPDRGVRRGGGGGGGGGGGVLLSPP